MDIKGPADIEGPVDIESLVEVKSYSANLYILMLGFKLQPNSW